MKLIKPAGVNLFDPKDKINSSTPLRQSDFTSAMALVSSTLQIHSLFLQDYQASATNQKEKSEVFCVRN